MKPLPRDFFARPAPVVARELLGHHIVAAGVEDETIVARIVETEAYVGPDDPGSHARLGRHTRAGRLWEEPGTAYVYVCYGIHQMLNVVAHAPGEVGGVLFRAAEPLDGLTTLRARRPNARDARLLAGPGNLGKGLGLRAADHDGIDLTEPPLTLAMGDPVDPHDIAVTGRIGLTQGGARLLRFLDATSPSISRGVPELKA